MKVLLVEDSAVVIAYVREVLATEPDVTLLPAVRNGALSIEVARRESPDVILMDLELPGMDGLDAIRTIMATHPRPIVVFSAHLHDDPERDLAFEALAAGAVEVLAKPRGLAKADVDTFRRRLVRTLRVMSQAKLVTRTSAMAATSLGSSAPAPLETGHGAPELVVIGASTGGPVVLHRLLSGIPAPYPLPIVVAQHIVPGFERGFAEWLTHAGHAAHVVEGCEKLLPGRVYVAPADSDLVVCGGSVLRTASTRTPVPNVDVLFESAARFVGRGTVGLLLTGMGEDGARGLAAIRAAGGLTVAQSAPSCVVDGMPGAARRAGAASCSLDPDAMTRLLGRLARGGEEPGQPARAPG